MEKVDKFDQKLSFVKTIFKFDFKKINQKSSLEKTLYEKNFKFVKIVFSKDNF
jgi:hypothetical protein